MSRKRLFDIMQIGNKNDTVSRLFDYFITIAIFVNLFVTFTLTFQLSESTLAVFRTIELVTMVIFSVEYVLSIFTANFLYPGKSYAKSVLLFMFSFYGLIDLLTVLPYWLPFDTIYGMGVFRIVRVIRIFHLFRVNSQSDAYHVIVSVIKEKRGQLLSSISLIGILMLSASFLMYSVEHPAQPEIFDNAFSGLWWAVSTVLTVGYGDIYPITTIGKAMAIVISILGVMITAIPTGILSAGFSENYRETKMVSRREGVTFTIHIKKGNVWIGQQADTLYETNNISVESIIRGHTQVPVKGTVIQERDILICNSY